MECFVYAFFMLIHISSVVFFIRFLVFISEQIGYLNVKKIRKRQISLDRIEMPCYYKLPC
ncbi:hypothetical protein DSECCO2_325420 [anaerobic digester metagenome]